MRSRGTSIREYSRHSLPNPRIVSTSPGSIPSPEPSKKRYGQLRTQSLLFASGLTTKHNLVPGDVILLFSANSIHYPLPLFGALAAGLTITTANSGYTPPELAHQIRNSGAKVVVCSSDLLGVVREALREDGVEVGEDRVFVMPGLDGRVGLVGGARSWDELRGDGKGFRPVRRTDERELEKLPACEWIRIPSGFI